MSVVSDVETLQSSVSSAHYDVVVVGAGPYGISTAAHLLGRGLKVAVFGKTLELWRNHMPQGMFLRSRWWATNLSDPQKKYGFDRFFRETKYEKSYPVPMEVFVEYALWFQKHAVPNVDETYVSSIEHKDGRFLLTLEDGRIVQSSAVVMAIGLYYYAYRPAEYSHMPSELVSHSFDHRDFSRFAGKQVVVIGGGQSAVESTALLKEAGVSVQLVSRHPIYWLNLDRDERSLWEQLRAPSAAIGSGWKEWALEYLPYLFYRFPQSQKDRYLRNHYTAAGAEWLRNRVLGKTILHEGKTVEKIEAVDNAVELLLSSGETLKADHVMLSTGYKVNIKNLPMIHESLLSEIRTDLDTPWLSPSFESSVSGLYFVGLSAVRSFGPLFRFVVGNKAAAQRVASSIAKKVAHAR